MQCRTILLAGPSALPVSVPVSAEETAAPFHEGAENSGIVPYRPGGGYDQYSRLIVPLVEGYSGAPAEIVNMPGAGGMKAEVELFRSAPDGLHVGILNVSALAGNALAGTEGATYDVSAYS